MNPHEIPPAVTWANYPGDARGSVGSIVGPMLGSTQFLTCVDESYDPQSNTTRLGFTYGIIRIPGDDDHARL